MRIRNQDGDSFEGQDAEYTGAQPLVRIGQGDFEQLVMGSDSAPGRFYLLLHKTPTSPAAPPAEHSPTEGETWIFLGGMFVGAACGGLATAIVFLLFK